MFHNIAAERLSRSCSRFPASVSLILLFWCFPLPLLSPFSAFLFFWHSRCDFVLSSHPVSLSLLLFLVLAGGLGGFLQIGTQMNNASKAKAERWAWIYLSVRLFLCITVMLEVRLILQRRKKMFVALYPASHLLFLLSLTLIFSVHAWSQSTVGVIQLAHWYVLWEILGFWKFFDKAPSFFLTPHIHYVCVGFWFHLILCRCMHESVRVGVCISCYSQTAVLKSKLHSWA